MATEVDIGLEEPDIPVTPYEEYERCYAEYMAEVSERCKEFGTGELVGEVLRYPRGDGYAMYAVVREEPLEVAWIPIGDMWSVEDALIRGLTLDDVRSEVERERGLREIFASAIARYNNEEVE